MSRIETAPRRHPGVSLEHQAFVAAETERLRDDIPKGGLIEAGIRAIFYIGSLRGSIDERGFNLLQHLCKHCLGVSDLSSAELRPIIRNQANIMRLAPQDTIAALPQLLSRSEARGIKLWTDTLEPLLTTSGPLDDIALERLREIQAVFDDALRRKDAAARRDHDADGTPEAPRLVRPHHRPVRP